MKAPALNATLEVTTHCNLSCKMCLVRKSRGQQLTGDEWRRIIDGCRGVGVISLLVTGGEPTQRADFCGLWEYISRLGFITTLFTNAAFISDDVKNILRRFPPHKLGVTLYGACGAAYERVCGRDVFESVTENIDFFSTLPSVLMLRTTVIYDNLQQLSELEKFAYARGVKLDVSRYITGAVRGGECYPKAYRLSPEDNITMLYGRAAALAGKVPEGRTVLSGEANHCSAGVNSFAVSADGYMYGCELLGYGGIDLSSTSVKEAWEALSPPEQSGECGGCELRRFCVSCPATRFAETGDPRRCAPYFKGEAEQLRKITANLLCRR